MNKKCLSCFIADSVSAQIRMKKKKQRIGDCFLFLCYFHKKNYKYTALSIRSYTSNERASETENALLIFRVYLVFFDVVVVVVVIILFCLVLVSNCKCMFVRFFSLSFFSSNVCSMFILIWNGERAHKT